MTKTAILPPPVREPRPVTAERALTGKRLIVAQEEADTPGLVQYVRDYRAASEVETGADGVPRVLIVEEVQWYAWTTTPEDVWERTYGEKKPPRCPRARAWRAEFCWVD